MPVRILAVICVTRFLNLCYGMGSSYYECYLRATNEICPGTVGGGEWIQAPVNSLKEKDMHRFLWLRSPAFAACSLIAAAYLWSQAPQPRPLAIPLTCSQGDCPVLTGAPQTTGMRSGFVRLKPGQTVGWHTTGKNEEAMVVLHGKGTALIEGPRGGQPGMPFAAPALVYIPPDTRHNVENTGSDPLEYEYVVAPAKAQ